jgi:hypothetical protein
MFAAGVSVIDVVRFVIKEIEPGGHGGDGCKR